MTLDSAIALLTDEPVDAVVLDVELCGARATDAFRRLQAAAPQTPIILFAAHEDTEVAVHLLREGAQDFLIAQSVDAVLLAHALGTAIERQRLLSGARAACMEDPLTRLLNRTAFLALADRDRKLAQKIGCRWMVVMAEPNDVDPSMRVDFLSKENVTAERRDLLLIETAERIRRFTGATDLLARVGEFRFGLGIFDTPSETLETAWSRIHSSAGEHRIAIGAAIFDFAHPLARSSDRAGRDGSYAEGDGRANIAVELRIALDATYSLGKNLSGVGVYSREILFGLARAHPEQQFLFCYRSHRWWKSFGDGLPRNASRRLLSSVPPRADLFHALNQRVDFSRSASGCRIVCTFHDLFVLTGEYSTAEFRARFAAQARLAAERSDAIIAVSRFTAKHVEDLLRVPSSRIHVIPHGVSMPDHEGSPSAAREKMVLFVGAIQRRKNIARLVAAFEKMPAGWRLALAGATDGYQAGTELHAIEESPRLKDIDVLGYVDAATLASLYARASIFAFPSLDEGFGIPVLEAMAHGIPVITSQCSALPEAAGDAAILVNPLDTDELASALNRLAVDEILRADLMQRGLARARTFSWDAAVEKTWEVYQTLLAEPPAKTG